MPSTITGDDSTGAPVRTSQISFPLAWLSAVIVPPWEVTIRRFPVSAGDEAAMPLVGRFHRTLPVRASTATVAPGLRCTNSFPRQYAGGYSIDSPSPRAQSVL